MTGRVRTVLSVFAVALVGCVLGFYQATAAPPTMGEPFANSVEQRLEMVAQLKEVNGLLKEQNALLREQIALFRSGEAKVIITLPPELAK